ncbi:MAG: hypothetical protein IPJ38_15420 [Dechloromonas sp.]|uniref:Uncharacterized protein n=1 Tax=Candidatus Dechloromonas phosphorivorans TaxID=2899244 RepID=A0A935JZP1_9RHOO|nr:hypothetical protein [Candidatus Dechloromonas phosphorivorans]
MSSETYILTMARKGSKAATNAPATYISQQQTQPERAQVAAITQRSTGEPIIPGKQLFGTWRPDHCDYWRGTERLGDIPCKATSDSRIEFTPRTLSLNGREVAVDEYIDNSNSIDVRFQGGVQRFFVDTKKDSVAFLPMTNQIIGNCG